MDMKIQLDPKQISKATKDLLQKQVREITKLRRKVDSLQFQLDQAKRATDANKSFQLKIREAKRVICDLFDIEEGDEHSL